MANSVKTLVRKWQGMLAKDSRKLADIELELGKMKKHYPSIFSEIIACEDVNVFIPLLYGMMKQNIAERGTYYLPKMCKVFPSLCIKEKVSLYRFGGISNFAFSRTKEKHLPAFMDFISRI